MAKLSAALLLLILSLSCRHTLSQGHNELQSSSENCIFGSYRSANPPFGKCSGFRHCEQGFYCVNGIRIPCPAGSYGDTVRLPNSTCSGYCSAGYYCGLGSISSTSKSCGSENHFCPLGSAAPTIVPIGYYSVDINGATPASTYNIRVAAVICPLGHYCVDGVKHACKGGTYGESEGLHTKECSGLCSEGIQLSVSKAMCSLLHLICLCCFNTLD